VFFEAFRRIHLLPGVISLVAKGLPEPVDLPRRLEVGTPEFAKALLALAE
jgi:hypothetical protein